MKIDIKSTNLDLTPAIKEYIEMRIGSLSKFVEKMDLEGACEARVQIARTTMHHKHGDVFRAECNLKLPGKLLRAEREGEDVRLCIDAVKNELHVEIQKYKEKNRPQDSNAQGELRKLRGKV